MKLGERVSRVKSLSFHAERYPDGSLALRGTMDALVEAFHFEPIGDGHQSRRVSDGEQSKQIEFTVNVDGEGVKLLIAKAFENKGKKSSDGPIRVKVSGSK
jgi:hypothetical protein